MRSIWKGAISFGLVTIPVKLYSATEERDVSFHQVHREDGGRIRYKRVCQIDGEEVPYSDIAKGYELSSGEVVVLTDEDFADLPLTTSRSIDVLEFVPLDQVDPIYFAKSYYLEPDAAGAKPYVLLREALENSGRVALVKVALRSRESLATLRVRDGVFVLEMMLWPDEIRTPDFAFLDEDIDVRQQELKMAESLIESLSGDFEPEQYADNYREALQALIDAEVEGREVVILTDDDFADLPLSTSRSIDVLEFVPLEQVDPIYFAKSYYLEPDAAGTKPYVLLREALEKSGRVALVKVALRQRESLATLRVREGVFVLEMMLWPDEVREAEFGFLDDDIDVRPQELQMAESLIDTLSGDFQPEQYSDNYREALQSLIEAKVEGREVVQPEQPASDSGTVVDLMAALRASVEAARQGRAGSGSADDSATPARTSTSAAKRGAGKKAAAKSTKKTVAKSAKPAAKKTATKKTAAKKTVTKRANARKSA
ncbi:MAG TPA: Ku protein [Mycobacteriales bacterium]|nr:Ku protein [Mycobacteriales bacterium]